VVDQEEAEAYRLSVLENMARKDMTAVEEATALKQLLETMTPAEAGAAVGYGADDRGQVTWKVKLLDAIPEVQDLVNKGHLNQTKAVQMSRLSRNGQLELLRKAAPGRSTTASGARSATRSTWSRTSRTCSRRRRSRRRRCVGRRTSTTPLATCRSDSHRMLSRHPFSRKRLRIILYTRAVTGALPTGFAFPGHSDTGPRWQG
jgi:ParB-like chromosome segregation protein Spo0J